MTITQKDYFGTDSSTVNPSTRKSKLEYWIGYIDYYTNLIGTNYPVLEIETKFMTDSLELVRKASKRIAEE